MCKTALLEYLIFLISQPTFFEICKYCVHSHTSDPPERASLPAGNSTKYRGRKHSILDWVLKPGTPRSEQNRSCLPQAALGVLGWWKPQKAGEGGDSDLGL